MEQRSHIFGNPRKDGIAKILPITAAGTALLKMLRSVDGFVADSISSRLLTRAIRARKNNGCGRYFPCRENPGAIFSRLLFCAGRCGIPKRSPSNLLLPEFFLNCSPQHQGASRDQSSCSACFLSVNPAMCNPMNAGTFQCW